MAQVLAFVTPVCRLGHGVDERVERVGLERLPPLFCAGVAELRVDIRPLRRLDPSARFDRAPERGGSRRLRRR